MLQALTTNRNRTAADVRAAFNRGGGALGESGCVAWNFETRGLITLEVRDEAKGEEIGLLAIDAGADDVKLEDGSLEIYTVPDQLLEVRLALDSADASPETAEISMVPKSTVPLGVQEAEQTLKLLDSLEDLADVQKAYTNADFPVEALQRYQEAS